MKTATKKTIVRAIVAGLLAALGVIATATGLTSCNVTRTVTTRSEFWQKGDTAVSIQVKTTETYDARKNSVL